jgi:single-strand DNA-binding protein
MPATAIPVSSISQQHYEITRIESYKEQTSMASRSVNKVLLVGHIGRDAETKFTPSGVSMTRFSVATNRRWKDSKTEEWKEETDWTNVVLWRKENVAPYLTKGTQVYVEGRIQTRSYDDKEGRKVYATDVVADDVILLGGNRNGQQSDAAEPKPASRARNGAPQKAVGDDWSATTAITDDDVPF